MPNHAPVDTFHPICYLTRSESVHSPSPSGTQTIYLLPFTSYLLPMPNAHWFPMYVTYHREERIKHQLDDMGIENFLPMKPGGRSDAGSAAMVPAIRNIIFVHTSFDLLSDLKQFREEYAPMQFVTRPSADGSKNTVLTVSDRQMRNFMFAYSLPPDKSKTTQSSLSSALLQRTSTSPRG